MIFPLASVLVLLVSFGWSDPAASQSTSAPLPVILSTTLTPDTDVVPGERVRLRLTVATPRWFTGGTRLRLPEVPGLLILQNQRFASNSTEQRAGQTWSVQHWTLDLFATRPGHFVIPPIEVATTVSIAPGVDREQQLMSSPLTLTALVPRALAQLEHWVASPEVSLSSDLNDTKLVVAVGDAIERRITVTATDVMAMMLPANQPTASLGLQHYVQPPQLRNRANRGQLLAERDQRTSWIATESGATQLPATEMNWWHTGRKELITLRLPAINVEVVGTTSKPERWTLGASTLPVIAALLAGLLVVAIIYRWRRRFQRYSQWGMLQLLKVRDRIHRLQEPALPNKLNPYGSRGRSWEARSHEP